MNSFGEANKITKCIIGTTTIRRCHILGRGLEVLTTTPHLLGN